MKYLVLSTLAAQAIAVAIPNDGGDGWKPPPYYPPIEGGITRTIQLPPLPTSGSPYYPGKPWPRDAEAEPVAEAEAEAEASRTGAYDGSAPDPSQVKITGITYAGTGCPAGSAAYAISNDLSTLTLLLSSYVASIGPYTAITENRKNCQLNLNLQYPSGFQYSIFQTTYRGYADLDKGVTGKQTATYYFSGQTAQTSSHTAWVGPYNDNYELTDQAVSTSVVWSPCGQQGLLNINSQIALTSSSKSAQGLLTTDSIDASFVQKVYIRWQKCTKP